jgi:hypothetical protein
MDAASAPAPLALDDMWGGGWHSPLQRDPELEVLDKVIEDCHAAHAAAVERLRDSVVTFRAAMQSPGPRGRLLQRAHAVRFALMAVRNVEAALRELGNKRSERLRRLAG